MGFFKKIFKRRKKRKRNGTKIGNFFRGVANRFNPNWGTGANLQGRPPQFDPLTRASGFNAGNQVGNAAYNQIVSNVANNPNSSAAGNQFSRDVSRQWLKQQWVKPVAAIGGAVVGILVLVKLLKK